MKFTSNTLVKLFACTAVSVVSAGSIFRYKKHSIKAFASPARFNVVENDNEVLKQHRLLQIPRGGGDGGLLDPTMVAKIATALCFLQGSLFKFCPLPTLDAFKSSKTPTTVMLANRLGASYLSLGVALYALLFSNGGEGTSVVQAMGYSSIVMLCELIFSRINDDAGTIGYNANSELPWIAFFVVMIYSGVLGADWIDIDGIIKAYGIFVVLLQSTLAFNPNKVFDMHVKRASGSKKGKNVTSKDELLVAKSLGYVGLGRGIFVLSLMFGVEPTKALGYGWIPQLVFNLSGLFVTGEVDDLGLSKGMFYMWLVFHAIIIGTLAF